MPLCPSCLLYDLGLFKSALYTCKERKCRNKHAIHPKRELNRGPLDLKSSTLSNELKRHPSSAVLVVVLINSNPDLQH